MKTYEDNLNRMDREPVFPKWPEMTDSPKISSDETSEEDENIFNNLTGGDLEDKPDEKFHRERRRAVIDQGLFCEQNAKNIDRGKRSSSLDRNIRATRSIFFLQSQSIKEKLMNPAIESESRREVTKSKSFISKLIKTKIESTDDKGLGNYLRKMKRFPDEDMMPRNIKGKGCLEIFPCKSISKKEIRRRNAIWELFSAHYTFLVDHLNVLKNCFMEPLKHVQVEGFLMTADPIILFGNLCEIIFGVHIFCQEFYSIIIESNNKKFATTGDLVKIFEKLSETTRNGLVYQEYSLNYLNAMKLLNHLHENAEYELFEKWCEEDPRCQRLHLHDLIIAPIQHSMKVPLLLQNIIKLTEEEEDKEKFEIILNGIKTALKNMDKRIEWLKNQQKVQILRRQLIADTFAFVKKNSTIPNAFHQDITQKWGNFSIDLSKRKLVFDQKVALLDIKNMLIVGHLFLFNDMLLVTEIVTSQQDSKGIFLSEKINNYLESHNRFSGISNKFHYLVIQQPIPLDRLNIVESTPQVSLETENGYNIPTSLIFLICQFSRYKQLLAVHTIISEDEESKNEWLTILKKYSNEFCESRQKDIFYHVTISSELETNIDELDTDSSIITRSKTHTEPTINSKEIIDEKHNRKTGSSEKRVKKSVETAV